MNGHLRHWRPGLLLFAVALIVVLVVAIRASADVGDGEPRTAGTNAEVTAAGTPLPAAAPISDDEVAQAIAAARADPELSRLWPGAEPTVNEVIRVAERGNRAVGLFLGVTESSPGPITWTRGACNGKLRLEETETHTHLEEIQVTYDLETARIVATNPVSVLSSRGGTAVEDVASEKETFVARVYDATSGALLAEYDYSIREDEAYAAREQARLCPEGDER